MSVWSKIGNLFRGDRLNREIEEEFEAHMDEAIAAGRDPAEVRRSFGSSLRLREASRDFRTVVWLDTLRADLIFGWRQLLKHPVTSAAAILSLGLAIGSCTASFRLIDALLLRPMPVAHSDRLYAMYLHGIGPNGDVRDSDGNEYPQFQMMRRAVKDEAEMIAASLAAVVDLTYGADADMEKAHIQYVSGWMFSTFGLQPVAGRLLTEADDSKPKAEPVAVLSYDYWTRRFGQDRNAIGRRFRFGDDLYEIVGVTPKSFTGTETGTFTDIFVPTMMHAGVTHDDWSWIRTFVQVRPGASTERIEARLQAIWNVVQGQRAKAFTHWPPGRVAEYLRQRVVLKAAAGGLSEMRFVYRAALGVLALIVGLVLLIACANVANLLIGQAAARSREMALRVSIGAGKARLMQLVFVESAVLAGAATGVGVVFAWWAAPFIVGRINPPGNPARLMLPADWRVTVFVIALAVGVTLLFGLIPALRASAVRPAAALKGGEDPHSRRRVMYVLIAAQVAVCFVVQFAAGGFAATLKRLLDQPLGFSAGRVLTLDTVAKPGQSTAIWYQQADHLRQLSGVENVAIASWPLLSGIGQNGFVSVNGGPPHPSLAYFLPVSPRFLETMSISLLDGRDLRPDEVAPGAAVVNVAFAKEYFDGRNPVGRSFDAGTRHFEVVGLVADARYRNMREPITPTAYIPLALPQPESLTNATFILKTAGENATTLAPLLRREVSHLRPEFRVSNVRTQSEIDSAQTVRERLLAMLSAFFAGVALLLAGIGLYGVLDYVVLQQRRELGIRIAIGASARDIAGRVMAGVLSMVAAGTLTGIMIGALLQPYAKALLYQVKPFDAAIFSIPLLTIALAALTAALPAAIKAVRIDPVEMLRAE